MWPCFYGVDTPDRDKLLAANMTVDEMCAHLDVDSLQFISIDGLYRAAGEAAGRDATSPRYCDACFTGDYPVKPTDMIDKGFELKTAAE
jgi:amidophosphoribosyltransferase